MNLRQLLIERVMFSLSPEELEQEYNLTEDEVESLSDLDLFELYEQIYIGVE